MRQHPIDLLPASIRARSQAGLRTGRYVASATIAVVLIVVASTHSRLALTRAQAELAVATEEADLVLATEARANEISALIDETHEYIDRYQQLSLPLETSSVLATLVNGMPSGMTLDRIDIDAGARRNNRSARSRGSALLEETPPRVLTAELSGFAPDDKDIAEFVSWLDEIEPFRDVSLDFSRTRDVNGHVAREFRLSFAIDLEVPYEVTTVPSAGSADGDDRRGDAP
jgi:hypothetical protein